MKTLTVLCASILLTACSPLYDRINGAVNTMSDQKTQQELFAEGIDQLSRQEAPEALLSLKERFPQSPWTLRANSIMNQSRQLKTMQKQIEQCETAKQLLQGELELSNQRLEALRELTIELELNQP